MAEAFVPVLLEKLASIGIQQIEKQVRLVVGVKKEVAKITSNLTSIQAVLEDADKRQVKEAIVRDWLEKLKDVSYEIDDVLDDWTTEIVIQQADDHQQEGETSAAAISVTKKKVCFFVPSTCFCFGRVNRVIHRRDIAVRIQDLSDRLNEIARERQNYNFQNTEIVFEPLERFETSSLVDISKIFGREDETKVVLDKLVSESSQESRNLLVIPIVGMGGMGKTTLAQMVYNDEKVKSAFPKRIWVCVSDPFNEIKIARAIIEGLKVAPPSSNDLQPLLECIHENVKGEKFLLVLDDVWNEDGRKWEQLKPSLQNGVVGSKIVVTTRKEKVAEEMGATTANMIHLGKLSEECCWSIFYHNALGERERNESRELESLGKQIVKKCQGLPLVAKVLGGLMRSKKTKREWVAVLESKIWELDLVEHQVFQPLLLSYYDLTPMIKRCLLYCVIFPKDHEIDKQTLIELWMSQGYLSSFENKKNTKIDIGESYFNNLVMRFFFQDFVKDELENIEQCKMHDIVHDFLQFLSKSDCFILEAQGENKLELPIGNKFRHLTIANVPNCPFAESLNNCKSLRTLTTFNCKFSSLKPESVLQLKCLRTLNLSGNGMEQLPNEVGELVHLRYLDLSDNEWKKLPDSLCDLVNLETLRVEYCMYLEELPEGMGKLTNLRHLHVKGSWELKLPKSTAKLTSLQILDQVNINANSDGFKLSHLGHMDQIQRELFIFWRDPAVKDGAKSDAEQANLVNKKHLIFLHLMFSREGSESMILEEMLNALKPNLNLESLQIGYYSGATLCPNWMSSLINLRRLTFYDCGGCEYVPLVVLGKLVSLEILTFLHMEKVKKMGFESITRITESSSSSLEQVVTLFPNLKELEFSFLQEWEEWEGMGDSLASIKVMPRLSTLKIKECHKLNTPPDFLWSTPLQNLSIEWCEILSKSCRGRGSTVWPNISHIPNIQIDWKVVQEDGVWIQQEEEEEEED